MILTLSFVLIGLAVFFSFLRLLKGPTSFDRLLATDTITLITTALLTLMAFSFSRVIYMDVALVYAVLGFAGVVVIARYLEGGL
ncbi:MAG: monovalent cation/H+ antiporter complex subunit F [Spirochaetota bacterium]|nr:monovalent cation/H+ antiporter complex subunit F [Spirochaetota bacterium]